LWRPHPFEDRKQQTVVVNIATASSTPLQRPRRQLLADSKRRHRAPLGTVPGSQGRQYLPQIITALVKNSETDRVARLNASVLTLFGINSAVFKPAA